MTKAGYTHIIVPKDLHAELKALAHAQRVSIAGLIQNLLTGINTGINTTLRNGGYPLTEREPISNAFHEKTLKTWWTGRDLNPRPRRCQRRDHSRLIYPPIHDEDAVIILKDFVGLILRLAEAPSKFL